MAAEGVLCYCYMHCPDGSLNGTCRAPPDSMCFAAVEQVYNENLGTYEPEFSYGCMPPDEAGLLQCKGNLVPHLIPQSIECCKDRDFCNELLEPTYLASDEVCKMQ
jgi:bone morphogenetic protein receptor type-1B